MAPRRVNYDKDALRASICRDSFKEFVKEFWSETPGVGGAIVWNWHIDLFCDELQAVAERVFKRLPLEHNLCINVSPGTSKSTIISILFPTWVWTRMPHARLITASHTESLVIVLANKARQIIKGAKYRKYFPEIILREDQDQKGYYANTLGGERFTCTGSGKSPMGQHGDFLICAPWETKVITDVGELPIGQVVEQRLPVRVLGYDHAKEAPAWCAVDAYETNPARPLTRLRFSDGTTLELTGDHPVYVAGRGYVDVDSLAVGDEVYRSRRLVSVGAPPTWRDVVTSVERAVRVPAATYNLKVHGHHNYFAEGVLVHNCDDLSDPRKQLSDVSKKAARDFMVDELITRKTDKAASVMIMVMQRLGLGDPTDVMLAEEIFKPVRHICLPSELTEDVKPPELAANYVGGYMDPNRLGPAALAQYKTRRHFYSTQFLQKPYAAEGSLFRIEWFNKRLKVAPFACRRVRAWDRGATQSGGAATAGTLMALDPDGRFYIEHVAHGHWEPNERNEKILAYALQDRTRYGPKYEPTIVVEAEKGSTGNEAFQYLARKLAGFHVKEDTPTGSKDSRAEPLADQMAAGNVYLIEDGNNSWDVLGFVAEFMAFQIDVTVKRLGRLVDRVDATCLVAGTTVTTAEGDLPIEQVKAGDRVLTRDGYKEVLWAGQSGAVSELTGVVMTSGQYLIGTAGHLVWTRDRGFVSMGELVASDVVVINNPHDEVQATWHPENKSRNNVRLVANSSWLAGGAGGHARRHAEQNSTGRPEAVGGTNTKKSSSRASRTSGSSPMGGISGIELDRSTGPCGNHITAPSPAVALSITKTRTHLTIQLRTLRCSHTVSTGRSTGTSGERQNTSSTCGTSPTRPPRGTALQKDLSGIPDTDINRGQIERLCSTPVSYVESILSHVQPCLDSALAAVVNSHGIKTVQWKEFVNGVEHALWQGIAVGPGHGGQDFVLSAVVPLPVITAGGDVGIPVYDLTIADQHEFFANGVLVHNSLAFNYLVSSRRPGLLRSIPLRKQRKGLRIFICNPDTFASARAQARLYQIIDCRDPLAPLETEIEQGEALGVHPVVCADLDPAEVQDRWHDPVEPYGLLPERLIAMPDQGKLLWAFLRRQTNPPAQTLLCHSALVADRRPVSVALAVCDVLGLSRADTVFDAVDVEWKPPATGAPNPHVYEVFKRARSLVL